jgi:hypothetical protein
MTGLAMCYRTFVMKASLLKFVDGIWNAPQPLWELACQRWRQAASFYFADRSLSLASQLPQGAWRLGGIRFQV